MSKSKYISTTVFHPKAIDWYVNKLINNEHYSIAGYSDAEWFSILRHGTATKKITGLGQILDEHTGDKLGRVLQRRKDDPSFLFAVPDCMWWRKDFTSSDFGKKIDDYLAEKDLAEIEFYERDVVTDDLAAAAGLHSFIKQLQQMRTVVIGNKDLQNGGLDFLEPNYMISIASPNLHLEHGGIKKAVTEAQLWGSPGVYLISAGVSAALIIDQLHGTIPNSWFIDCGSIWDAFVGVGVQRKWRQKLYKNPKKLEEWKRKNIYGS